MPQPIQVTTEHTDSTSHGNSPSISSGESSSLQQVDTTHFLSQLKGLEKNSAFHVDSRLMNFLHDPIGLDVTTLSQMAAMGWVTSHMVVNCFGLDHQKQQRS